MRTKKFLLILLSLFFSLPAFSQGQNQSQFQMPRWKAGIDSFYYDFQGRHPADGNIYGFEGVHFATQMITMGYNINSTTQLSVVGRYTENYAETQFLGTLYKDKTKGFNDTLIKGTKTFFDKTDLYIVDVGLSLPTGSINEKNQNNLSVNYPYNMQLGSGTYDLQASLIYIKTQGKSQLGSLGMATARTGRNEFDYRKGNEYIAKVWYTYLLNSYLFPGIWLNYHHIQRLSGADNTYGRNLFVEFYHSPRHFWDLTLNMNAQYSLNNQLKLKGLIGRPLWQESKNIDNVQVYTQWFAQLGIESNF